MKMCKDCDQNPRYVSPGTGKVYSYCSECSSRRSYGYQKSDPEKYKRYYQKYRKTEKGKSAVDRANKKYVNENRDIVRERLRNANRLKNGFTPELFESILISQNYKCALCFSEINISSHADHNHDTGSPRGILCHNCNTTLGKVEKLGFDWVDRAKIYLDSF
jgi:hypothetical protein